MYFPVDSYKTEQLQFSVGVIQKKKKKRKYQDKISTLQP